MNTYINTLNVGDRVQATLIVNGRILVQLCETGVSSMKELVRMVYDTAGMFRGYARLQVRNQSQGWAQEIPLMSCVA